MARVLIIESDCLLAKNLASALTIAGHEAVYTADAQAAITSADTRQPDAIILDLLLAGRSGVEFLYELRSYPEWQSIPVVVYSNLRPSELPESCLAELGIARAFYKPVTKAHDLVEAVGQFAALAPA
jgi:DNA-binding response OmpR family regulator